MQRLRHLVIRLIAGIALGFAATAVAGAGAAQGGRFSDRLDVFTHFAPLWLALGLAAALLGRMTPPGSIRAGTMLMAAAGCVSASVLIVPEYMRGPGRQPAEAHGMTLKVIQFNAWSGWNIDPVGSARWLAAQDADLILAEEMSDAVRNELLKRRPYHVACESAGRCQVAIFSKTKPVSKGTRALDQGAPFPAARATFDSPSGPYTAVAVHFTWPIPPGPQQQQGLRLAQLLQRYPKERMILAGDFNSTPWSFTRRRQDAAFGLERRTRALFSWPVRLKPHWPRLPFPLLPIDQFYAGPEWRTIRIERGPALGSDHYPVIVTLRLAA